MFDYWKELAERKKKFDSEKFNKDGVMELMRDFENYSSTIIPYFKLESKNLNLNTSELVLAKRKELSKLMVSHLNVGSRGFFLHQEIDQRKRFKLRIEKVL